MENSWHQLQPKTSFLVRLADRLTDQSWQTLTQLYQPIIGPSAAGLYSALFWLPKTGQYHRHATLLAILGMDLAHLYDARLRLEATGLLTTTVSTKDDLTSFNYDLHAPLLPAAFFKDDLLSVQLLGVVGEDLYQSLVSVNTSTTERSTDEENITKNFLEVFHVDGQELAELPTAITAGRQRLDAETQATAPALQVTPADFDFKLLGEILEHSFIDTRALRSERQLLLTEHATYGLDEVTMARYIGEATDLATNQFNAETFKRVIAQNFGRPQSAKSVAQPQKTATTPANQSVNSAEQALIKVATNTAPAVFLQAIKQKSGGFVTDGEQRIVRDLVSRQLFPEAVLNLMVYHVLVDEDRPTLNKNLLDTIANDWSKAKITTPEQAIQKIRERQQAAKQPRRSRARQSATVKETLPEGTKTSTTNQQASRTKLSAEKQKQLQDRIAKLQDRPSTGKED